MTQRQLLTLGGITDEWFPLGYNVAAYDTLGWGHEPILLRPPGYPAFIAGVLRLATRVPPRLTPSYTEIAIAITCVAQAVLLAATAALLFAWLRGRVGDGPAFAAALLYGLNPYSLVLPGLLHYDLLHLFLLVAGCAALDLALLRAPRTLAPLAAAGALWGLAALVRPVTLPLPLFVLVMVLARGLRGRRAAAAVLAFSLAMAAVIAPWTVRNFRLTGRLIPVNVQGWAAVWGSTVVPMRMDPNEYQWHAVAMAGFQPIYVRVTGEPYDYLGYLKHNVALEAAFKEEALRNLRRQPQVYLRNVARGFLSLGLQLNTSLVSVFQRIQRTGERVLQPWFWQGADDERRPTGASRATDVAFGLLTALAGTGIVAGVYRRDLFLVVPVLVYLCVALAHALTYFDFNYYYLKLPFLIVFATLGADALGRWGRRAFAGLVVLALAASTALVLGL